MRALPASGRDGGICRGEHLYGAGWIANWFALFAYWEFKYYGHREARVLDGGKDYWINEDYELTHDVPEFTPRDYAARGPFEGIRAFKDDVRQAIDSGIPLVDVRSPPEFTGEILAPEGIGETAQVGGHIPGAKNVPTGSVLNDDGTFKSADELRELYASKGVTEDQAVVTYCRVGERSSIAWFVLTELLGYGDLENYDGSWTEWGNLIRAPIETGEADRSGGSRATPTRPSARPTWGRCERPGPVAKGRSRPMTDRFEYVLDCEASPVPPERPPGVEVRRPTPDDADDLAALMLDAYRGTIDYDGESIADARTEVAAYLDEASGDRPLLAPSRVAVEAGQLASACLVSYWGRRNRPLVGSVMTRPSAKRRGLARVLLAESVAALCGAGYPDVRAVITAGNTASERLFAGLGFRQADP